MTQVGTAENDEEYLLGHRVTLAMDYRRVPGLVFDNHWSQA